MSGPFRSTGFTSKVSRAALLAPFMLLAYALPAAALTYEAESKINAVTVYLDRAKIERTFELELGAGTHEILVPDLPEALLPDSLRISAQGPDGLVIGSADLKRVFAAELIHTQERRLLEELQAVRDQIQSHDDTIAAARLKLDFIRNLSQHAPMGSLNPNHSQEDSGRLQPESWQLAWTLLSDGTSDALRLIRTAEVEKRNLGAQQQKIQRELGLIQSGARASSEARIKLESAKAGTAKFTITYQQHGASWRPIYDARLKSEDPHVTLVQRAEVRQQTGEDWRDVALTLSTARPGQSSAPVELPPWLIDFQDLKPLAQKRAKSELRSSEDEAASVAGAAGLANAPEESFRDLQEKDLLDAAHREANLIEAPFTANYRVPGRAQVAADNSPANFLLGEDTFQASLSAKTVPAHEQVAYLIATYKIERDSPYLPGRISLFRDGTFVGTNWLPLVRPGEEIETAFGADDRIKVEYRMVKGERSSEGLITRNQQTERRYKMVITNLHTTDMPISVIDQLPVSRDERIEVELIASSSEASERNPDDREGLLVWDATYRAGESREIDFGYRVIFPEGLSVAGF